MPLVEYECQACGYVFERLVQRVNPTAVPPCPRCRKSSVERLWSTFAARTGSGGGCGSPGDGIG